MKCGMTDILLQIKIHHTLALLYVHLFYAFFFLMPLLNIH